MQLRVDTIEQALRDASVGLVGPEGYLVARDLAVDNLRLGRTVIVDAVNPLPVTRRLWHQAADRAGVRLVEVELRCSDLAEHRRRVETRSLTGPGLTPPTWQQVREREFQRWPAATVVETAHRSVEETLADVLGAVEPL